MPTKAHKDYGPIFWLHLMLIISAYSLPFWVNWKLILVMVVIYRLQLFVFGGCVLTILEQKNKSAGEANSFHRYYLTKAGINVSHKRMMFIVDYVVPVLLLIIALVWQVWLGKKTLI